MQYNYNYENALRALRALREAAINGRVPHGSNGVCGNLTHQFGFNPGYEFVPDHADDWPHAMHWTAGAGVPDEAVGKLKDYFVPHVPGFSMWEGPNLELRLDLIDHLIGKCEAALAS